jgi:hypothetical protein
VAAPIGRQAGDHAVLWTELQRRANALKENPAFTSADNAGTSVGQASAAAAEDAAPEPAMESQADQQDEMPLVWPVLSPAELAAVEPPALARAFGVGPVLMLVGGALTLAGMMFAIISLSGSRSAPVEMPNEVPVRRPRPARMSRSVSAAFAEAAAVAREVEPPREVLIPGPAREAEPPRKASAPARRTGNKREPITSGEALHEIEERMPWLVVRGKRSAAA